jgi:L-alanine-DL-glutamate epimerase-like enolase superfamily enzyme
MQRRNFLTALAGLPALGIPPAARKISSVDLLRLSGRRQITPGLDQQHQVQPLHVYEGSRPKPYRDNPGPPREAAISFLYLRIRTEDGAEGVYGPIDREVAIDIELQLKPFILGKDALAGEKLWDQMHRWNRHGRAGHLLMAISAIDNCLWDLRGRVLNMPVYRLLGGPTRDAIEVYGSCLGFSVEPEAARAKAAQLKAQGYLHQKWFLAYGPGDGMEGMQKNVALVRALRESVGPDVELMFDAFMGWTLDYSLRWCKEVEQYRPRWIEEAFPPDKLEAFAALRKSTSIPVATGEHLYGRWEAARYLQSGAISVVQSDPEWCGGVSELVKICGIASLHDAVVIPHGHGMHAALHVVASQSPATCPLTEYLISKMGSYYHFEKRPPKPVNASIELTGAPGFGIEFDPAKVEKQETWRPA